MTRFIAFWLTAFALVANPSIAPAQTTDYPTRIVRFIVPFGPGSGTDIAARLFAQSLAERWGKPVVVENRPGGDGLVAINAFLSANEDHTLLFVPVGTFGVHPFEREKLSYEAKRDLIPISSVTTLVLAISAAPYLKVDTLSDFVALARKSPGTLNGAPTAGGADLMFSAWLKSSGLQVTKIPYRDILQAPVDLGEGRLQLAITSLAVALPHRQAGRIKVLAVTSRERAPNAPDIPTAREAGFPELELESLVGIFGPRGMPDASRQRVADAIREIAATHPEIMEKLASTGQIVTIRGLTEFAAGVDDQSARFSDMAKTLGLNAAGK